MTITPTIVDQWSDGKRLFVVGTLTFAGAYVTAASGDPVSFANTSIQTTQVPTFFQVQPANSGYDLGYTKGTTRDNGFIKVWQAFATELGSGNYPASLLGDTAIQFLATFKWGI